MAHYQQKVFCEKVKNNNPDHFKNLKVLDVGSLDINGSNRFLFESCVYIGLDIGEGKNVDVVTPVHLYEKENESFDTIISTECFEHDKHYSESIKKIYDLLKPGGMFIFTCATTGRREHGTSRTSPSDSPFTSKTEGWVDYYKNLEEKHIREVIDVEKSFSDFKFEIGHVTHDLYFYGIKK